MVREPSHHRKLFFLSTIEKPWRCVEQIAEGNNDHSSGHQYNGISSRRRSGHFHLSTRESLARKMSCGQGKLFARLKEITGLLEGWSKSDQLSLEGLSNKQVKWKGSSGVVALVLSLSSSTLCFNVRHFCPRSAALVQLITVRLSSDSYFFDKWNPSSFIW